MEPHIAANLRKAKADAYREMAEICDDRFVSQASMKRAAWFRITADKIERGEP